MHIKKDKLLSFVPDCLSDFFYYDRKECEEVSREDVGMLFKTGILTGEELKKAFCDAIDSIEDLHK